MCFGRCWSSTPSRQPPFETSERFGEIVQENSGENPGGEFEKFGELSFCNFSDLTFRKRKWITGGGWCLSRIGPRQDDRWKIRHTYHIEPS